MSEVYRVKSADGGGQDTNSRSLTRGGGAEMALASVTSCHVPLRGLHRKRGWSIITNLRDEQQSAPCDANVCSKI